MEFSFAINIPQIKYSNIRESIEKSGDFGYTHFKIRKLIGAGRKIRVHRARGCSPLFFGGRFVERTERIYDSPTVSPFFDL